MNNLNYPLTNDITPIIRDYRADILLQNLGSKIKLILGFIYLFSLLFFTIRLFT
jgi:hypothetical protein